MSFYRLFLSASSHTQQGGSAGVHGGRRLLSSHEILRLLSFLACKKRKENFLRTDRNKTLSSFSSSSFSSSSSCSFSSSFIPLPSSSSSLQGFIESRVEPSSSKDFDPSISKEEKEKERKEEDGEREESSVAQEREGGEEGLVSNEKLFVTSHIKEGKRSSSSSMTSLSSSSSFSSQDGTSPPSPSSECSERVLRYERRERLTSSSLAQERNLEEKLLLALCRRMCIRGVFSSLRPSSLIDLLLLLSELRVKKFTPLLTEISRSLQPLCPSIDLSKLSTTPDLLSAAPSKHVGAGEGRAPRLFSLSQDKLVDVGREDIEETSQTNDEGAKKKKKTTKTKKKKKGKTGEEEHDPMSILHDLSSCGLNTVFTPNDLVCIYTSFASLGAREFQQFLRSLGDVLSLHIPHFPFTTDVSLLYSCSQLNFYPRNLINSLLYHLPKKLSSDLERYQGIDGESKSHPDQGKTEMTLERGGENQRASGVHTPLEAHRDNLERTCFKKDYFLEDHPSDNRNFILPSPSFSPSAPLYERSGGRMKVSFLLKALARLNSRHKPTLSITLEGLKHHHHVRVDPLRNKDPSSPKKANPPIYSCSSSSFSPSLSTCSSDSSSPVKSERSHTGPESLFFWRTGEVEDDAVSVLYSLYRLDVWHAETIHRSLEVLSRYDGAGLIDRLGLKGCLNTLLAV
ncbi:rap domain-containing protein, partial [Cystoisospora suis]